MIRSDSSAEIVIGRAARLMVQIVEFADRGITGFQHFHLNKSANRLDIALASAGIQKAEHDLTPGPETVARLVGATLFTHAGHRALKRMAVQVDYGCGQQNADGGGPVTAAVSLNRVGMRPSGAVGRPAHFWPSHPAAMPFPQKPSHQKLSTCLLFPPLTR